MDAILDFINNTHVRLFPDHLGENCDKPIDSLPDLRDRQHLRKTEIDEDMNTIIGRFDPDFCDPRIDLTQELLDTILPTFTLYRSSKSLTKTSGEWC